ncbi:hypothetical protein QBC34DRAFT_154182 [Podospora aff. communis PSN243]|uniref:Rhodopsin domain-containing protein n=1 Tax=Podospora aff. communis PSN243 TaxID=3040156 RepID=A0AAV9GBT5_9PEZI|nr:hypothetical protein QBC34DRAFT_154182 [Podospora aff. communis PSN243]
MTLYTPAPPARPFSEDKPTLLVSWWVAGLCSVVIILRLAGRYIRVEKLFIEDKIAAIFLVPLFLRTAFVHIVLLYGTNNVSLASSELAFSDEEIRRRSIGSGLVLLTRVLHPAALWTLKFVNLEFFSRLVAGGRRRYVWTLCFLRGTLVATFLAIIISDLAECRPFGNYWVLVPDPGGQCRQGYAQLFTQSICSGLTDIMLVVFPVPIIASSRLKLSRKIILTLLFCLGLLNVAASAYRVPKVLSEGGYQGTRTTWASMEILVATFVANALALGSFVRDTGAKKSKFRHYEQGSSGMRSGGETLDGERGRRVASLVVKRAPSGETTDSGTLVRGGGGLSRSASKDSLISRAHSRGHAATSSVEAGVMKTTTIQVTVSEPREKLAGGRQKGVAAPPAMPQSVSRSVSASARGVERGSTIVLKDMDALPRPSSRKES